MNLWGSFALGERPVYKDYDEIDLTLDYTFSLSDHLEMSAGFINYGYFFGGKDVCKENTTQEFYVSAGWPEILLSPTLTLFYDFNLGSGLYALFEASHSVAISESLGLDLCAELGYNSRQFIEERIFRPDDRRLAALHPRGLDDRPLDPLNTFVFLDAVNEDDELWFGISLIR